MSLPAAKVLGGAHGRRGAFRPASLVNISGMSYGSLSPVAVEALNRGAALAGCLHNTGEGGLAPAHQHGGELIYQIGTGYFGCRDEDGRFSLERLRERLAEAPVRAIEIKLSQGAKPGLGGLLPAPKVTEEIAAHPRRAGVPRLREPVVAHRVRRRRRADRVRRARGRRHRPAGRGQVGGRRHRLLERAGRADGRDRRRPGLRDHRRRRGRHRRRAAGVQRPRRAAVQARDRARLPAVRARGDRRGRRLHRRRPARLPGLRAARDDARLRHGQRRPRGDARDRLHPGPALPHRQLPDRGRDAEPLADARARSRPEVRARGQLRRRAARRVAFAQPGVRRAPSGARRRRPDRDRLGAATGRPRCARSSATSRTGRWSPPRAGPRRWS